MSRSMMAAMSLAIVALLMAGGDRAVTAQGQQAATASYCAGEAELEMLRRINQLREENGLAPLELSQPLGVAAERKARDMAEHDYVAHVSPDGQGLQELLERVGYDYTTAFGENIAAGQRSAEATFEQWLNSPEHREIMLGEQFTAVGIGRAHNPDAKYGWYWAAEFGGEVGKPAEPCGSATPAATPADSVGARPARITLVR